MHRPCPNPWCVGGRVAGRALGVDPRKQTLRACATCRGAGVVHERDERDEDLRGAGIVVDDATDEDFRSSPTHWTG